MLKHLDDSQPEDIMEPVKGEGGCCCCSKAPTLQYCFAFGRLLPLVTKLTTNNNPWVVA